MPKKRKNVWIDEIEIRVIRYPEDGLKSDGKEIKLWINAQMLDQMLSNPKDFIWDKINGARELLRQAIDKAMRGE